MFFCTLRVYPGGILKSYINKCSFLREELYTLHIIGFLKIIEAFTSPGCRDSTHHNDQKLLL